jgi:hypothetical protein
MLHQEIMGANPIQHRFLLRAEELQAITINRFQTLVLQEASQRRLRTVSRQQQHPVVWPEISLRRHRAITGIHHRPLPKELVQ